MNRARIIAVAAAAVVVTGGIGAAAALSSPDSQPLPASSDSASSAAPTPTPSPTTTPTPRPKATDPLTGGKVSNHEVIAAKVENIAAARPQVGLSLADITFVEEVEGAQTRLIAIYHTRFPKRLGPIRSARSTDVELLPLFGKPGLVYSGANAKVQRKIDNASIVPIPRSTRDHRRVAPHNVFVDLAAIARSTKLREATPIGWTFGAAAPRGAAENSIKVRVGHDTFGFSYSSRAIHRSLEWSTIRRRRQSRDHQDGQRRDHEGAQPSGRQSRRARRPFGAIRHGGQRQSDHLPRRQEDHRSMEADEGLRSASLHRQIGRPDRSQAGSDLGGTG